jgi:dipeptidyl aminopeptidase/acylaminoacyl peptidase
MRLTDVATSALAQRAPVVTQRFSFKGADGDTVWGQITKPSWIKGRMPSVLFVHGGPQGSYNDSWSNRWNPRVWASQGYAIVSVDFHGSTGYGQAFTSHWKTCRRALPLRSRSMGRSTATMPARQVLPMAAI